MHRFTLEVCRNERVGQMKVKDIAEKGAPDDWVVQFKETNQGVDFRVVCDSKILFAVERKTVQVLV